MSRPAPKGWCPGAYRPMMSGDGLVVRIRPQLGRIDRRQALGLCALAQRFGSGILDLTSRANIQIRGVSEDHHEALLQELHRLGLLPDDPALEARRNILLAPDWQSGDDSHALALELSSRLAELPDLPAKFGFAIDNGSGPILTEASADIRIERHADGLLLRADGAALGRAVTLEDAIDRLIELAQWFANTRTQDDRRMRKHLTKTPLPDIWAANQPFPPRAPLACGSHSTGHILGAAFGQMHAKALADLIETSAATALRMTPWRLFLLEYAGPLTDLQSRTHFITQAEDPLLRIDACPGAPLCASASVATHALARNLAGLSGKHLHISGCAKGCARPRAAALTLIGRDGAFDLVKDGHAWDAPSQTGLTPDDLKTRIGEF